MLFFANTLLKKIWPHNLLPTHASIMASRFDFYSFSGYEFLILTITFLLVEWIIYIALYCVLRYTQTALQSWGGGVSPQPPPVCSIYLDDATAVTGQRRQSSGLGLLGGHDWQGPVEGIWTGHRGYTPTLYEKCHGIFNDHRESGPRFNVSSERRCLLTVCSSSPLLSLVRVPAKLAINLSIHTQHTYDNGVDRTGRQGIKKNTAFTWGERRRKKINKI